MSHTNNILIITNSIDMGGRETRLLGEIDKIKEKYDVSYYWINIFSNKSTKATELMKKRCQLVDFNLPSNVSDISLSFVMDACARIISFCKKYSITAIYIHNTDVESLIGVFVAQQLKLPIFVTIHGKGMVYSNRINPILHFLFFYISMPSFCLVAPMSYSLRDILSRYPIENLKVIPNLVNTNTFRPNHKKNVHNDIRHGRWLIVSRLSIEKYVGILEFIKYAYKSGIKSLDIVGSGTFFDYIQNELQASNLVDYVNFLGESDNINELSDQYDVIVGCGRVILEAISIEKYAVVIGSEASNSVAGFVNNNNIEELSYRNFSGRNLVSLSIEEFKNQLDKIDSINLSNLRKYIVDNFSEDRWIEEYADYIFNNLTFRHNSMVADLYATFGNFKESLNSPFYTDNNFLKFLEDIVYSRHSTEYIMRAYQLMLKRISEKFIYPNIHHIHRYHLKVNRPVLKGDELLLIENIVFTESSKKFLISNYNYNYDIDTDQKYIVFLHFYHSDIYTDLNIEKEKLGLIIQLELFDLKRGTEIICSSDFKSLAYSQQLGFYRTLAFNNENLRDGVRLVLSSHIKIKSIKISSLGPSINVNKLHVWVTY